MKEVSYFLGFSDPFHFSKFFKNETGTNFTEFKEYSLAIVDDDREYSNFK
ncbi:helix-turn-helix domain-containing protein [Kaistella sp. 97-N-M2]|nr:helix-turn-helix domain-containing protein [Kaistella sp. 97-N-M2]UJF29477.1 helix-turn-helix domain-containing protein [Kaistella sp. 97-N-M2]